MERLQKRRNFYLDLFKFFLCFLVIAIHLTGDIYWYFPVYRLAVPMFFIISGYFNYSEDKEINRSFEIGTDLSYTEDGKKINKDFHVDANIVTMHSPDIEF
jgi:hypothetical protein